MFDQYNLFNKIQRVGKSTALLGGFIGRNIGEKYLGVEINDAEYADFLRNAVGQMRGPIVKMLQFLATVPDALPKEYSDEFFKLQSHAPSMGEYFVKRRMKSELGDNWQSKFKTFETTAAFAASLGQVHRAGHLNGSPLACKLQYPAMEEIIQSDLQQLSFILKTYYKFNNAISSEDILREIQERLLEETDYTIEAKNIGYYQKIFKNNEKVNVPTVYDDLSTKKLLTMGWLPGKLLTDCFNEPLSWREQVADNLFYAWYYPLYHFGCIHGDPHPGNYLATDDASINLLDFGCIKYFSESELDGINQLYQGISKNDHNQVTFAYQQLGFTNLNTDLIEALNLWAKLLYDPILDDRVRPITDNYSGKLGQEVAMSIQAQLQKLGGVKPPRAFIFLDRAAVGLGAVFMRLKVDRNWYQLYHQVIK